MSRDNSMADSFDQETLAVTNSVYWPCIKVGVERMDTRFVVMSTRLLAEETGLDYVVVQEIVERELDPDLSIAITMLQLDKFG